MIIFTDPDLHTVFTDKEEHLSLKLVDLGIPKELAQMDTANFQQQAIDIVILFLRKGCLSFIPGILIHILVPNYQCWVILCAVFLFSLVQLATLFLVDLAACSKLALVGSTQTFPTIPCTILLGPKQCKYHRDCHRLIPWLIKSLVQCLQCWAMSVLHLIISLR